MSETYAREILRRNVAQICQTIGWNGINSTPLDILVHILEKYIRTLGTQVNRYAEEFNRTEPNLHDLGLVFRDLHINLPEISEYTRSVPPVSPPVNIEKFPIPKESNLNFLKPGSHEVVTRPMHVHDHLPPMYPEKERDTPIVADTVEIKQNGLDSSTHISCTSPDISVTDSPDKNNDIIFKRPNDPISVSLSGNKRPRLRHEEEERTREISSVMMTMSGFLSPAREGKLPEAKAPPVITERHHDKHKSHPHHSNIMKAPIPLLEKVDKKSKKNKTLNGKIMKSKRKDKSHKGESSKIKDALKTDKLPPGFPNKSKEVGMPVNNHIPMPLPKTLPLMPKVIGTLDQLAPIIKQEPIDPMPSSVIRELPPEDTIPVPRKIPISKSPLVPNAVNKMSGPLHPFMPLPKMEIKKEVVNDIEKLASQPDKSKLNIFKRISNKNKDDRSQTDGFDKTLNPSSSRLSGSTLMENLLNESNKNNSDSALDLSTDFRLTTDEVIDIDDDFYTVPHSTLQPTPRPNVLGVPKHLQSPYSKDIAQVSPKPKKEKKHKDKKDKQAKLEAKLIKKQQLALEIMQGQKLKSPAGKTKSPKTGRPKTNKMSQMHPGYPFFPNLPPGADSYNTSLVSGPGLVPNPSLMPGEDFLAQLANNPALRDIPEASMMSNPFSFGASGPGLIPGPSYLPGSLGSGIPNPLMALDNYHKKSHSNKIPSILRRPSLEVIPVDTGSEIEAHNVMRRDKDKQKASITPNILQKQKKTKAPKSMKMAPEIHPDITIELNPPREPIKELPSRETPPAKSPVPSTHSTSEQTTTPADSVSLESVEQDDDGSDKRKDKSHKKEKKDKDGMKIKKKKDKKDKSKDKAERKKDKIEKLELKDKIKKEKKDKRKDKNLEALVPKLTLKLGSASPLPPSSPDVFKLNIKPVVKTEDGSIANDEPVSREGSRSPELAQFSALVTRPPKSKHSKHNNSSDIECKSPDDSGNSPTRKTPSSSSKYKRILFKSMVKKNVEPFNDDMESIVEDPPPEPVKPPEKLSGQLPTPFYVDEQGNQIWVCPACGKPDNGTPMIGCDGCDGWYHWVCVGITEEPGTAEDWFCKSCISKRASMHFAGIPAGRKRGRKPKSDRI